MKISIGIDIGADGAWAMFVDNKLSYGAIPYISQEPDMKTLKEILLTPLKEATNESDQYSMHCVIEDLHSVHGSSAASNFTFGVNNGLIIGLLQAIEVPFTKIGPKIWQKEMWQGIRVVEVPSMEKKKKGQPAVQKRDKKGDLKYKTDTKATSLIAATRLFPKETFLATQRSKVAHNGIVDACLLAEFARRHF